MTWATVAVAGASIVGGVIANQGTKDAAKASGQGQQAAIDEQRRQFDVVMGLNQPAINTGNAARSQLASLLGLSVPNSSYSGGGSSVTAGSAPKQGQWSSDIGGMLADKAGLPYFAGSITSKLPDPGANLLQSVFGRTESKNRPYAADDALAEVQKVRDNPAAYDTPEELQAYINALRPGARQQILNGIKQAGVSVFGQNQTGTANQQTTQPMSSEDVMKRLESLPGYQFAVNQARQGAAALGSATGSLGGNVVSALGDRIAGGIAGPTFENYLNRLAGLSNTAQTAVSGVGNAAINTGQGVAQNLAGIGDTRASGIIGQTNTIGGVLNGLGGAFANYQNNRRTTQPVGNAAPWANPTGNGGLNYLFGDG